MAEANDRGQALTGRCYCGATGFSAGQRPRSIAYCHCRDCRRVTGAPVAAFAAFDEDAVIFSPDEGQKVSVSPGVVRSFCGACGSPLVGRYDYLPEQLYIPVGLFDQAEHLAPELHAHEAQRLRWLHIADDLPRHATTARCRLAGSARTAE